MTVTTLDLDDDIQMIHDTLLEWVRHNDPIEGVRLRADAGETYDPQVWVRACRDLGISGIAVSEELGGAGLGATAVAAVCEAAGRELALEPLLPTIAMALFALQRADRSDRRDQLIGQIVDGSRAALLTGVSTEPFSLPGSVTAKPTPSGVRLNGTVGQVIGANEAELLVVLARSSEGSRVAAVPKEARGVTVTALDTIDLGRPVASVRLDDVRADDLGPLTDHDLAALYASVCVFVLADLLGSMTTAFERGVEYAKQRVQFGRAIGSFQAVKHRCVDMLVDLEGARSQFFEARAALTGGQQPLLLAAGAARIVVGEAGLRIARSSLHVHGGLGFTWEDDAHLHLRRAKATGALLGSVEEHVAFLARGIGLNDPLEKENR